jgi:hypothetical protein
MQSQQLEQVEVCLVELAHPHLSDILAQHCQHPVTNHTVYTTNTNLHHPFGGILNRLSLPRLACSVRRSEKKNTNLKTPSVDSTPKWVSLYGCHASCKMRKDDLILELNNSVPPTLLTLPYHPCPYQ